MKEEFIGVEPCSMIAFVSALVEGSIEVIERLVLSFCIRFSINTTIFSRMCRPKE